MIGIYKITSPSNKVYIGQSVNIEKRIIRYKNLLCKEQTHLYRSLQKYGWDNHVFEIIVECKKEELNELEIYYIDLFKTFNSAFGLNLRKGGEGGSMTEESREKIRQATLGNKRALGKKHSEETKKRCGELRKGKTRSDETKRKMSQAQKGKKVSDETKLKLSIAWKNRKVSDETRLKMAEGQKRRQEKLKNNNKI